MKVLLSTVSVALGIQLIISIYLIYRNERVYRYRLKILSKIHDCAIEDMSNNPPQAWRWRYTYFNSVGYNEMLAVFWKPLDSFYPDKSFIESSKHPRQTTKKY